MFEQLESRRLLSVSIVDRVVVVSGTEGDDQVSWGSVKGQLRVTVNGKDNPLIQAANFDALVIDVGNGNDRVFSHISTFAATVLGGSGNDVLSGGNAADAIVGGKGNDWCSGGHGNDTLVGGRGSDTLAGDADADHITGGAGDDTGWSEGPADTLDVEVTVPMDTWLPLKEESYAKVLDDVRVKFIDGRGWVAVLDFYYGSTGFREQIVDVKREGNTFRVGASVERWEGGSATVMTRHIRTATLGHKLPKGSYSVVVHSPSGAPVERQRFTVN